MPGASLAYVGPGDPQATFEPAPGEDPFETYPVAVAYEFFSIGRAVELRAAGALSSETLCEADIVQ